MDIRTRLSVLFALAAVLGARPIIHRRPRPLQGTGTPTSQPEWIHQ